MLTRITFMIERGSNRRYSHLIAHDGVSHHSRLSFTSFWTVNFAPCARPRRLSATSRSASALASFKDLRNSGCAFFQALMVAYVEEIGEVEVYGPKAAKLGGLFNKLRPEIRGTPYRALFHKSTLFSHMLLCAHLALREKSQMGHQPYQSEPLFTEKSLDDLLKLQQLKVEDRVENFPADQLLLIPLEDIVDSIYLEFFIEPLVVHRDKGFSSEPVEINHYSSQDKKFTFRGFGYELIVPFSGALGLLRHHAIVSPLDPPFAFVNADGISVRLLSDEPSDRVKAELDRQLDSIDRHARSQARQLDEFNSNIRPLTRRLLEERKSRILRAKHVAASLGFPMKRIDGAPETYITPKVRKTLIPALVKTSEGFVPEPTIAEAEYQNILRILENMTYVMERNPSVFANAPEETIRDHYLVQLNGQYQSATGETFNAHGKTDILVRDGNKNLFIAECKIWHGEKEFKEAIEQLFSYLTWRDTKSAIVVFSHNRDTSGVVETIVTALEGHPSHKRRAIREGDTRVRSVFGRPDDVNREITVTVMVFPIPKADRP